MDAGTPSRKRELERTLARLCSHEPMSEAERLHLLSVVFDEACLAQLPTASVLDLLARRSLPDATAELLEAAHMESATRVLLAKVDALTERELLDVLRSHTAIDDMFGVCALLTDVLLQRLDADVLSTGGMLAVAELLAAADAATQANARHRLLQALYDRRGVLHGDQLVALARQTLDMTSKAMLDRPLGFQNVLQAVSEVLDTAQHALAREKGSMGGAGGAGDGSGGGVGGGRARGRGRDLPVSVVLPMSGARAIPEELVAAHMDATCVVCGHERFRGYRWRCDTCAFDVCSECRGREGVVSAEHRAAAHPMRLVSGPAVKFQRLDDASAFVDLEFDDTVALPSQAPLCVMLERMLPDEELGVGVYLSVHPYASSDSRLVGMVSNLCTSCAITWPQEDIVARLRAGGYPLRVGVRMMPVQELQVQLDAASVEQSWGSFSLSPSHPSSSVPSAGAGGALTTGAESQSPHAALWASASMNRRGGGAPLATAASAASSALTPTQRVMVCFGKTQTFEIRLDETFGELSQRIRVSGLVPVPNSSMLEFMDDEFRTLPAQQVIAEWISESGGKTSFAVRQGDDPPPRNRGAFAFADVQQMRLN